MRNEKVYFILLLSIVLGVCSCKKDDDGEDSKKSEETSCTNDPVQKNGRLIGLDLLDLTETNIFSDNNTLASELGIEFIALHVTWTSLEPSPGNYTDPDDALQALGQFAEANGFKFSVTIRPIDLTGKTVPSDLETTRFKDTNLISRFKSLVDYVFTRVNPDVLLNLQIGNEIDGYDTSSESPEFWSDYGIFLDEVKKHIQSSHPNLKVGFTGTLFGLVKEPVLFNELLNNVDVLGATYYPLKPDFNVKEPTEIEDDISDLVEKYPSKPIYFQEIGYQTSSVNNSSNDKQAAFYCEFFRVWDLYTDEIKTANIVRLNDYSQATAEAGAGPYGISDNSFIEYLRTLGIRTYNGKGEKKTAFSVIKENLELRGW